MHAESGTYKLWIIEMMITCFQIVHETQFLGRERIDKVEYGKYSMLLCNPKN